MRKIACFAVALSLVLVPAVSIADGWEGSKSDSKKKPGEGPEQPSKTAPFASWSPAQQGMPVYSNGTNARSEWGYANLSGMLLLGDELGYKLSEIGRMSLVDMCFLNAKADSSSTLLWALCGPDSKAVDLKKLDAELTADGVTGETHAEILKQATADIAEILGIGAVIDAAAKTDPGLQKFLKVTDDAKAEWAAYLSKNKDAFARYLALKDAVRSGKSNNPGFAGCFEATGPAFTKLVKATAPKIPWEVGNDPLPGYMKYLTATTEGYITTVAWAACAWSIDPAGEAPYAASANQDFGGNLRAGWRTLALSKYLDKDYKPKFADRSLGLESWTFQWKYGVKMSGINEILAIQTPQGGEIATLKAKDDQTAITFKAGKVEQCLQWADTNQVHAVNNGNVQYEKVCKKRGMVADQEENVEAPTKYMKGAKVGDRIQIIGKFPVVTWKGKKLTSLLGVPL